MKQWRYFGIVLTICLGLSLSGNAQITLSPISHGHKIQPSARTLAAGDTLSLPFWDDFSTSSVTASSDRWVRKDSVFINSGMGITPPSLNVATLDGVDHLGIPYSEESSARTLDILQSKPIDLSQIPTEETAVLSFYYQRQGNEEGPEEEDYLQVLLKNSSGEWVSVEDLILYGNLESEVEPFQRLNYEIKDEQFLHAGFQFRIECFGNPTGLFDAWHLDYFLVDSYDLDEADWNSIEDHSISTPPSSIFQRFSQIPFDQFFSYPDSIFDTPNFYLYSLFSGQQNPAYSFTIKDTTNQNIIFSEAQATNQLVLNGIDDYKEYFVTGLSLSDWTGLENRDSLFLEATLAYDSDNDPKYRTNDTARFNFQLHETLSYDDGTAEFAAGINQSGGEIAVKFSVPSADTLTHVDINFPQFYPEPSVQTLVLRIYSALDGKSLSTLRATEIFMSMADSLNQFTRYELPRPVVIYSGDFYIGLTQSTNDRIAYGLDKNTSNQDMIYYNVNGTWVQNTNEIEKGSLMIRAVFADNDHIVTAVEDDPIDISIYPNPANQQLNLAGHMDEVFLLDLSGQLLLRTNQKQINTASLRNGVYLIKIISSGQTLTRKIIIQH